jgi:hypothetical protein
VHFPVPYDVGKGEKEIGPVLGNMCVCVSRERHKGPRRVFSRGMKVHY